MGVFIQVGAVKSSMACKEFHPSESVLAKKNWTKMIPVET
jgi:hypothetical protein